LYHEGKLKIKDLTFIAKRMKHNGLTKLAFEWQILPSSFYEKQKKKLSCLELNDVWKSITEFTNFDGEKMFPNLESLVEAVLSFFRNKCKK